MKATISNSSKILTMMALSSLLFINCTKETQPEPEPEPDPDPVSVVEGCDTFTEQDPSLNTAAIDFECTGNAFLEEDALSADNLDGNWGRFGGPDGQAYLKLNYIDNPNASGINTSTKVLSITENAGIEPWAGFFFNLNEKVNFPSGQEAIAIDVHSAAPGQDVLFKMEDSTNSDVFKESRVVTTAEGAWETLTYNFTAEDSGKYDRIVIIANIVKTNDAEAVYYMDNIRFTTPEEVTENGSAPTAEAAAPTKDASEVMSIFSDAYTDVEGTNFNPNWGQATVATIEEIATDKNVLKYEGINYQGTEFASALDASAYQFIHLDYWTADSTALNFFLISTGPAETAKALDVTTKEQWISVDIPLSDFSGVDLADIIQFKVDGNGTVFFDNIYFHTPADAATEPTSAAPAPTAAEGVMSIFSDSYTDVEGTNFNPDWGQATASTIVEIATDNSAIKYQGLNYQGTQFASALNVSAYQYIHIDYWTADSTALNFFLISTGPQETAKALDVSTKGEWVSVDIPLSDFTGVDLADVIQFKVDGNGTVFFDNIYFHN
ncbi:MAG: hypothetical protein HWD84_02990 [Flavobacteriaceae bacterium]|nr:hypothetical protein [Flavobacteriaceae bacterium]